MKFIVLLLFVLSFSLYAEESQSKVALVSLSVRQGQIVSVDGFSALKKSIKKNLEGGRSQWSLMSDKDVRDVLVPVLEDSLKAELQYAKDAYYSFHFSQVNQILLGRTDAEACLWRALADFSLHKDDLEDDLAKKEILSFIMSSPRTNLSVKEFSPKFLEFVESVRKTSMVKSGEDIPFQDTLILKEDEKKVWQERWRGVLEKVHLNAVILVRLETVGWNQKLRAYVWQVKEPYFIEKNIEFVGPPKWGDAGKILVNTVFSVDTLSSEK